MTDWDKIEDDRRLAADAAFEDYDFSPLSFEASSGWEHATGAGEAEWTRPAFLQDPETPDADSLKATFVVRFADSSATVTEVYASIGDDLVGKPGAPASPAP